MSKLNDFMLQWGVDKFLHFMAGAAIFAITGSWIVLLVVSFGKELYDRYNGTSGWNNWDALATIAGGVVAFIGQWVWNYLPYTEYLM
tara:strand:+ start:235 stop:495 length:261 start_codon:yes stop_codon:yes gene_type:complete